jgi:hypothetical protein
MPIDFTSIPSGVSVTDERINQLNARATETGAAFSRRIGNLTQAYADAQARFNAEGDSIVASTSGADRNVAKQLVKKRLAQQVLDMRRKLIESSATDRAAMLTQLKSFADEAGAISAVCESPTMMLGRVALGDPRKGQLIDQLTGAGQFEVETAARLAVMQGDIVLAAAVLVVVDRKSRDRRPFAISDLAERVMGPQFKDADRKLKAVQLAYRDAVAADLEFNRGGPNPTARISSYLAHRALDESESTSLTD